MVASRKILNSLTANSLTANSFKTIFVLFLVLLSACSPTRPHNDVMAVGSAGEVHGSITSFDAPSGTFTNVYRIFATSCANCHSPEGIAGQSGAQLDFTSLSGAYSTLQGVVASADASGACPGVRLVVPGQPGASYLAGVLFESYHVDNFAGVAGCTPYAGHLVDQNLSAAEQASVLAWIQAGAPNN